MYRHIGKSTPTNTAVSVQIPIICIANDGGAQKLKPLKGNTFSLTFKRYVTRDAVVLVVDSWLGF